MTDGTVRPSAGCEHPDALLADVESSGGAA